LRVLDKAIQNSRKKNKTSFLLAFVEFTTGKGLSKAWTSLKKHHNVGVPSYFSLGDIEDITS